MENIDSPIVKVKVHAGSAREGQVLLTIINPENQNDNVTTSNIQEMISFCEKRNIKLDQEFNLAVIKYLHNTHNGLTVPTEILADHVSTSSYLKKNFPDHY